MRPLADFLPPHELDQALRAALYEDIGAGDATVEALVPFWEQASATLVAKAPGTLAGLDVFARVFRLLDSNVLVGLVRKDGDDVQPGDLVASVEGKARALLSGERTALNFLQRLSGIATRARALSRVVEGTRLRVLDTRKTTPGLRLLEKYAVQAGGASNHRIGLFDMILVKENHLRVAGGIAAAVERCRAKFPGLEVEVETTTLDEVRQAVAAGVDRVMFDNMDDTMIREALAIVDGRVETEASGNMDAARLAALAGSGLDFISVGALTHSAPALDLSLLFDKAPSV